MPEKKFFDTDITLAASDVTGEVWASSVCLISQGLAESNRIGRKIMICSISFHVVLELDAIAASATPQNGDLIRLVMYQDRQCNGAAATWANIFSNTDTIAHRNLTNAKRFYLHYDRTHELPSQSGAGDGSVNDYGSAPVNVRFFKRCRIPVLYTSTAGALTEITSNNLGFASAGFLQASESSAITGRCRIRYYDN